MGVKRVIDSAFWTDGKVDEFSPEDKYFLLYLLTNPFTKQLGIYEISVKQAAFQLGYSEDAFRVLLDRFENKYHMILFSKETNEIAILNFLRHSILKGGKPVEDCIKREMTLVKNRTLIDKVFRHLKDKKGLTGTVKKIIIEYFNENNNDIQNDNDNDNDNESTGHDTSPVRSTVREEASAPSDPPAPPEEKEDKPKKLKCGEYKHVLLTKEEIEKLTKEKGAYKVGQAIKFLDEYIEETGYKRKSHYLSIKRWVFDAIDEKERKNPKARQASFEASSFDADEFFEAAMAHSFDDDLVGVKTAANDEGIRERANELRGKLGQGAR